MKYDVGSFRTRARVLEFTDGGEMGAYGFWDDVGAFWCRMDRARVNGYLSMSGLAAEGWKLTLRERRLCRHNCLVIAGRRHWILDVDPPADGYMTVTTVTVPTVPVTLYNVDTVVNEADFTDRVVNNITVIREALIAASVGSEPTDKGTEGKDSVKLYIPFGAVAVDGVTGGHKRYVEPAVYERMEDKSGVWTLRPGAGCFFLRGEAVEPGARFQELSQKYGDVFAVGNVETHDFYTLRHFQVEGR